VEMNMIMEILWIQNVILYKVKSNEEIETFVYKHIFVIKSLLSLALQETQCHRHFWTCRKKKYFECRVHHPLSPMHTIRILGLFQMNGHINLSKTFIEKKYKHFFETWKEMGMGNDSSFDDFLNIFKLNGKYIFLF
jgi:hypothetical protein